MNPSPNTWYTWICVVDGLSDRSAYLTAKGEECADDLGDVLFLPKVHSLEYVDVWDTIRFNRCLETAGEQFIV